MPIANQFPGHLLVANPNNPRDELYRSVILLITHHEDVAIGIQLNKPLASMTLEEVMSNSNIDCGQYKENASLYFGGSQNNGRVHVVHSSDWSGVSTVNLNKEISITHDIGILSAIARGRGPRNYRACAGCWIWQNNKLDYQLDAYNPMERHRWEIADATAGTIFSYDNTELWRMALDDAAHFNTAQWF